MRNEKYIVQCQSMDYSLFAGIPRFSWEIKTLFPPHFSEQNNLSSGGFPLLPLTLFSLFYPAKKLGK